MLGSDLGKNSPRCSVIVTLSGIRRNSTQRYAAGRRFRESPLSRVRRGAAGCQQALIQLWGQDGAKNAYQTLRVRTIDTCESVKERAQAKIGDIERKIRALQQMRRVLGELVNACARRRNTDECPILDSLEAAHNST